MTPCFCRRPLAGLLLVGLGLPLFAAPRLPQTSMVPGTNGGSAARSASEGWVRITKLSGRDREDDDLFGNSVSLSTDRLAVGALKDEATVTNSGAAYVFAFEGTDWTEEAMLTASDAHGNQYFGWSVSLSGDTLLVGAVWDNGAASNAGAAYVFERGTSGWSETAKLTVPGLAADDHFGGSVVVVGDTAVVGGPDMDGAAGASQGRAFVFQRSGTSWIEQAELIASDYTTYGEFGKSVAMDGDTIVVGASGADAAYVFTRQGTTWTQQARLVAGDGIPGDYFGYDVALHDDQLVVGAPGVGDLGFWSGAAYVFLRQGTVWTEEIKLIGSGVLALDAFGCSVSGWDDTVIAGARGRGGPSTEGRGSAFVGVRGSAGWFQEEELEPYDTGNLASFGSSVDHREDVVLVGARRDTFGGISGGAAYVFERVTLATATFRNDAAGNNLAGYGAVPPVLGAEWNATVDNAGTGNFAAGVMGYAQPLEAYLPNAGGWLLVDPLSPGGELLGLAPAWGHGLLTFRVPIPLDVSLAGLPLSTQAVGFGGGAGTTLHNAWDLVLGA